jgi:hypothetical protein
VNLYPDGHQPFHPRGSRMDQDTVRLIQMIAEKNSPSQCLTSAAGMAELVQYHLEAMRAKLFRAEQLAETAPPLPQRQRERLVETVHELQWLLDTLEPVRRSLEEWLESPTCLAILATPPHAAHQSTPE